MPNEKVEAVAHKIAIEDLSTSIAVGLQRALDTRRKDDLLNFIIRYGGRIDLNIELIPANLPQGEIRGVQNLEKG